MHIENGFQPPPTPEDHPYTDDPILSNLLKRLLPSSVQGEIEADLVRFGNDIKGHIRGLSPLVHPPQLTQYDQWGRRIDRLDTSEGWRKLKEIAIKEGLVAIHHERKFGEHSRIYGFMKAMIFAGDSHEIMCPLSMTDGVARVLELFGTEDMKRNIRFRLISRDPALAFTAGQWMTERPGGSDVSQTETVATLKGGSSPSSPSSPGTSYSLDGFKWFSSATDSQVSVALARTGSPSLGSRSLSLFLIPLRLPLFPTMNPSPISNGILIHRLKNKFGTHALPTAELSLNGTEAYLLGPLNQGVKTITPVLNITRMHSAVMDTGALGRALAIARSYASVRYITVPNTSGRDQGNALSHSSTRTAQLLKNTPLHVSILAKVSVTYQALVHLSFGAVALLGRSECGVANEDEEIRLRLLTPAVKAFVSDKAVVAMEDCMAALGGQGYMEENVIGRLIRDSMVDRIWEGTISVLSLDLVRASTGKRGIVPFLKWANRTISSLPPALQSECQLDACIQSLRLSVTALPEAFNTATRSPFMPRPLVFLFAHLAAGLFTLEHVVWAYQNKDTYPSWKSEVVVLKRWVEEGLDSAKEKVERVEMLGAAGEKERAGEDVSIVYGVRCEGELYGRKQTKL